MTLLCNSSGFCEVIFNQNIVLVWSPIISFFTALLLLLSCAHCLRQPFLAPCAYKHVTWIWMVSAQYLYAYKYWLFPCFLNSLSNPNAFLVRLSRPSQPSTQEVTRLLFALTRKDDQISENNAMHLTCFNLRSSINQSLNNTAPPDQNPE